MHNPLLPLSYILGKVETELLLQCICLHLDVCHGAVAIWRKLAFCLLEVEQRSQQLSGRGVDIKLEDESREEPEEVGLRHSASLSQDKFLEELWLSRYIWWLRKHFNIEVSGNEQYPGGKFRWFSDLHLEYSSLFRLQCRSHRYLQNSLLLVYGASSDIPANSLVWVPVSK